jgi:hypothetical protein
MVQARRMFAFENELGYFVGERKKKIYRKITHYEIL